MNNIYTIVFTEGFIYKGVRHGWKDGKLYRLPFERNIRTFKFMEIKPFVIGSTDCYNVQRDKITRDRIEEKLETVNWSIDIYVEPDCPF